MRILFVFLVLFLQLAANADAALTQSSAEKLMASGKSMSCSFHDINADGTQEGTVYISGGKMRGDFKVNQPGMGTFDAHVINDKTWQYVWGGPMGDSGMKMSVADISGMQQSQKGFDSKKEMNMDCNEWKPNASFFVPPSNVQFSDASQMMQSVSMMSGQAKQMQCSACEQVPAGSGRDQCLRMMGC